MELYEKADPKIIQKTGNIEVIDINDHLFIRQINPGVIIMPYTSDDSGFPVKIGVISEVLDQRPGGMSMTLITGSPEDDDKNIYQTAVRELREESGFEIKDLKRWKFLGSLYTSKMVMNSNSCFAVDITGTVAEEKETDGSQSEKDSKFELISVDNALDLEDSLVSTLFIKTFKNLFNKNEQDTESPE
jgi:8-oxo-dGTP pyrophosphatase MutT (NUDIX family)